MIPDRQQLICQDCGATFPRGRSKSYLAKFCQSCRGKHSGRPSNKVTALPVSESIPDDWHAGPEVSQAELTKLSRKLSKHILIDPNQSIERKLSVVRMAGRWDQKDGGDKELATKFQEMMRQVRGGASAPEDES